MNVIIQTMQSFQTQKEGGRGFGCWGENTGETLVDTCTRYMIVYSQENHTKIKQLCLSFL